VGPRKVDLEMQECSFKSPPPNWRWFLRWTPFFLILGLPLLVAARVDVRNVSSDSLPLKLTVIDGDDIRFRRLSAGADLSQTRVASVVQDKLGFIWFGTQYGLDRYDGYKSKIFKHEPGRLDSLSCVYIRSLFVDHSGTLWVGCDRSLDKLQPMTETFAHYRIDKQVPGSLPNPIERINEDDAGMLWLATERGLYRFNPATGETTEYLHNPGDRATIAGNRVNAMGQDRDGRFWVANSGGLDEFDRATGKVTWHAPFRPEVVQFHEDKFGVFWLTSADSSCRLATLNVATGHTTCHTIEDKSGRVTSQVNISGLLESGDGTMWMGSWAGLLKLDRQRKQLVRYHNHPSDDESLESDNVISIYQDSEGNVWTCFQETAPNFFSERPQAFENFTYKRGSLVSALVTSIYQDHNGIVWIGSMGGLNRIDRHTGKNGVPAGSGVHNEILSILEDRSGVLFSGTFHQGLQRLDHETGKVSPYVTNHLSSNLAHHPITRLIFDHDGTLWGATYGGVSRFDPATGNFITYTPEMQNAIQYQEIKEDRNGMLWLGAQSGLHRFDPRTGQFTIYQHDPDHPESLSDNRVNSIHFDRSGRMWVGTQNGLDEFDPSTGTVEAFYEQDGLAGDVVSCILEDKRGSLWMSTNNGLSSLDPRSRRFQSFSAADGLPGRDLTGWGACYQSPDGEMFFGGFSGAAAFFPNKVEATPFIPTTVLTDFRLSGNRVSIGPRSPLRNSITYTSKIVLSHWQNILSIEFSTLSFFNPETNRYRYRLDGLDRQWHEVGSDQRIASYTTLPAGSYIFHVQGAVSRGRWSEPGASLQIEVLPAWWNRWWFRVFYSLLLLLTTSAIYMRRVRRRTRVEEEDKRLRQAQAELVRASRISSMGELTASLAHEIKQPIGAAVTNAEVCLRLLNRNSPDLPEAREAALEMTKDARRAADIIDRVRMLYQKGRSQLELVDVNEVIAEMLIMLRNQANGHSVTMRTDLAEGLPTVMADRVQLQQVFMNLMLNGIEAMKDNGGELSIRSQLCEDRQLLIAVTDSGIGLPAKGSDEIFNAFFTTKPQGTGLGLAITRSIVESHGGRIWATANSERGTTLYLTLPIRTTVPA
jgi:signal transduction histidine kinase/ligand-binding sensor domain-containing protein